MRRNRIAYDVETMKRTIELKHVGPREHVQHLLEELIARLEDKVGHLPSDAVSVHVVFDENGRHKLYRTSLTCHVPGRTLAAHEESREAGATIRRAFAEVERQLEKYKAVLRHEHLRRRSKRLTRKPTVRTISWLVSALWLISAADAAYGEEPSAQAPSPKAVEAIQLLESEDPYQRQVGFLRLEALREPSTAPAIKVYIDSKDPELRAYSLRALAAIEGLSAVPFLLERLKTDKHPRVRRAALLALEPLQAGDQAILPACIVALRDRNTEVRMTAVDIVSRIDDPRAREAIVKRYKWEGRRDVRRVLKMAMKRLGP